MATLADVWDAVFTIVVGALNAMVLTIAVLSLIALPALLVSYWISRRRAPADGEVPGTGRG